MSLRTRILAAVLVPSVALLTVGIVLSTRVVADALDQRDRAEAIAVASQSTLVLMPMLAEERAASIRFRADLTPLNRAAVNGWRVEVDARIQEISATIRETSEQFPAETRVLADAFGAAVAELPAVRQLVDAAGIDRIGIYRFYNRLTGSLIGGAETLTRVASDADAAADWSAAAVLVRAADELGRGNALAAAALSAGTMTREEFDEYLRSVGAYLAGLDTVSTQLGEADREDLARLRSGEQWQQVSGTATQVLTAGFPGAATSGLLSVDDIQSWQAATETVATQITQLGGARSIAIAQQEAAQAGDVVRSSTLTAVAMLAVLVVLVLAAFVLTTRLVGRLVRLHRETLSLSDRVLPDAVARLRAGEQLDLDREIPQLDHGADEIGQVAVAFNHAQRTAVQAAVEETQTRAGFNEAFLNIARRSQAILHRQMQVLDRIERAESDPDQLELLFQLDHLATRERRNAENLIILGGDRPRRQWRAPVPLHELVRGAIGEAEQYQRIMLSRVPQVMVAGPAVGDLVHLLAELLDNATAFSPPETTTEVYGTVVGRGVVVEVEDKGLGIEPEQREELNTLLRNPPDFGLRTLSRDARIGLFVVARLARRHGVIVTLRDSVYGGVRAGVLIPNDILVRDRTPAPAPPAAPATPSTSLPGARIAPDPEATDGALPQVPAEPPPGIATPPARSPEPDVPVNGRANRVSESASGLQSWPPPAAKGHGHAAGLPTLPRRRRKAHMHSRLRGHTTAPSAQDATDETEYTPEIARSRMSALQRGTRRGRTEGANGSGPREGEAT